MRKAFNTLCGVKCTTVLHEEKAKVHKDRGDSQDKKDNCLSCGKPADKCRGTCYGRNK